MTTNGNPLESGLAGSYGSYVPVAGHPLVRIEAHEDSDGVVFVWYIGDREPLLGLGIVPEERLTFPRQRKTGKGSRPRMNRRISIDAYWRSERGQPVRRFRVLVRTTMADALDLPGVREALQAGERRQAEDEAFRAACERKQLGMPQAPELKSAPVLRLVVDNTRGQL